MRKSVQIKQFSTGSMVIVGVLTVLFAVIAFFGFRYFGEMMTATERYAVSEQSVRKMQKGSDLLTEQVRQYVLTGQREYMDGYFEEANVTCRREEAVQELRQYFTDTEQMRNIEKALEESNFLMERELYAMLLTATALEDQQLPADMAVVKLSEEDSLLTPEQMREKAQKLVIDDDYQDAKERITENVERCEAELLALTKENQNRSAVVFKNLYIIQALGLLVLLLILVIESRIIHRLIVNPLVRYNENIDQDKTVPVIGAAELQSLAKTYNRVYKENKATRQMLHHEAEHDALSGLLNRGMFNRLLQTFQQSGFSFALVLADIDTFKSFNDTYGHVVGDQVIQKVAGQLRDTFRDSDFVFRMGGDEFAVILADVTPEDRKSIEERLVSLRQNLMKEEDGLPPVFLSIGIAFADRKEESAKIYQDADMALYYVKNHGKNGYRFSGDVE